MESAQKTYAAETNEILQQIEKKWEPVFNRPKEASFEEFLERFRNYVQVQQCTIPEVTGKDLKNKAKEISLSRSVAMCGWRTGEIKALPEEIFDLFAILFKKIEESQIWPEILLQVVTTFIPKVDDEDLDKISQKNLACPAPEEMRPINNASPWYSIYTSLRYEQMENWRNEVMPSSICTEQEKTTEFGTSVSSTCWRWKQQWKKISAWVLYLWTGPSSLTASKEILETVLSRICWAVTQMLWGTFKPKEPSQN